MRPVACKVFTSALFERGEGKEDKMRSLVALPLSSIKARSGHLIFHTWRFSDAVVHESSRAIRLSVRLETL